MLENKGAIILLYKWTLQEETLQYQEHKAIQSYPSRLHATKQRGTMKDDKEKMYSLLPKNISVYICNSWNAKLLSVAPPKVEVLAGRLKRHDRTLEP